MFFSQILFFVILCCPLVFCEERGKIKDVLSGAIDITPAVQKLYPSFLKGGKQWKSSVNLFVPIIKSSMPTLTYTYYNATLSGLDTCKPTETKIYEKDTTYKYELLCERVVFYSPSYMSFGKIGTFDVAAKGSCTTVLRQYKYKLNGQFTKFSGDKKGEEFMHLDNYLLDADAKGKITYDYSGIFYGKDDKKAKKLMKFVNSHDKFVDLLTRQPIIDAFMSVFVDNMNDFLAVTLVSKFMP